jgi:nicotinamide-nucleotide amidase
VEILLVTGDLLLNQELLTQETRRLEVVLLAELLQKKGWLLATAESCTGGMISAACTDLAGSSNWFERGFVSYSNDAKTELLGVDAALIAQHGAVSEAVARAMAAGAISHSKAQVAVAVTGVAGPTGGTRAKPVGTVCFGFALAGSSGPLTSEVCRFDGDRAAVRSATVQHALQRLVALLQEAG